MGQVNKYAQVVLGIPVDKAFTYSIPESFRNSVQPGQSVKVSFGRSLKTGYIVGLTQKSALKQIKPLESIVDKRPLLDTQMLKLTRKVADYYYASWGEVIEAAIPASVRRRKRPLKPEEPLTSQVQYPDNGAQEFSLSFAQKQALRLIKQSLATKRQKTFLLHGITASGKTEVYLQAIKQAIKLGKSAIVLVPEIALTPQTEERFKLRFGRGIALMHSRLLGSERARKWQMIRDGRVQIVIGPRSAVFAPLKNLGLIVIDEEHETTYKQEEPAPRYHARQVAMLRAKLDKATVILGSATPSLESFYNAKQGRITLLKLPERVTEKDLPEVNIVNMRDEIAARKRRMNVLSRALELEINKVLGRKEQTILFLNRRGFSTFINCPQCGYVARCKRCNVSLIYHYATKMLICHYCNFSQKPEQICPQCQSGYLRYFGLGTEKVESELNRLFPQARIARMDTDVTVTRGAHGRILGEFKKGKIDVLIGTQMVAKGLDFPRVGLVGVVSADTALNLPDFRSGERTFNLLTQVGGRAGRGKSEGKVIIQTYVPEHYAIVASIRHDYHQFYRREIKSRKELNLPPFAHLVNLTLRNRNQKKVQEEALDLALKLKKKNQGKDIEVLGPAPARVCRIRGNFRWNVLIKGKNPAQVVKLLDKVLPGLKKYKTSALIVDVDPI